MGRRPWLKKLFEQHELKNHCLFILWSFIGSAARAGPDSVVSKSAFLYVFRPGKFVMGGESFTIFLNDEPICEMSNKASYIVRLAKEGETTLVAKVGKQQTSITFDIKAGNKYFLRCELPWSLAPKPRLFKVDKEEAQPYFDNIK
jgi:hypothetical protein